MDALARAGPELDAHPLFPGHALLVPRGHHVTLPELPPELLAPLFAHARAMVEDLGDGLKGFFWPRLGYQDDAHREAVRESLAGYLRKNPP